ncbi:hypothetical protein VVR84_14165 [Kocuria carniphila]|uniref:Uncharacterized protein n=1 Tax=Kocuria carniphila TaxID=262208 RepID=A0ABV3V4Z0_9MICC
MARRHKSKPPAPVVPAVLPLIVAEAHGDTLVVTTNGDKASAETVTREDLWSVIADRISELGMPTRIELHEPDGRVHADILDPPPPTPAFEDSPEEGPVTQSPEPHLVELNADGFVPGEEIVIAVVIRHASADADGRTRVLLDPTDTDSDGVEVVLAGRISGTATVRPLT